MSGLDSFWMSSFLSGGKSTTVEAGTGKEQFVHRHLDDGEPGGMRKLDPSIREAWRVIGQARQGTMYFTNNSPPSTW